MKKVLLAIAAVATMTGCSQNEEFETQGTNNEIKVGTVVRKSTRAADLDNAGFTSFTLSSFIVEANQNYETTGLGEPYMNGVTYSGGQGKWTATGKYYWPTDKNVQFFGYSDGSNFTAPATGYPTLSFTIGATFDVQKDLVVAALSSTKPENNASVQLSFKHILTKVNFSYKPEDGYTYTISKMSIKGLQGGNATYTFAADPIDGEWLTESTDNSYNYPISVGTTATNGYYALGAAGSSLMLLPQSIAANAVEILISYEVSRTGGYTYKATDKVVKIPESTWGIGQSIRYKLALPAGDGVIGVDTSTLPEWDGEDPREL
ncbi:fimbrillin family protein [Bacteroides thetaiotaomicron]|jgi:hypothetical protein|uniref:fimbrillin family protein n=1 Tax=Bacteroides thetaiotaomicron TaxID=818 RepID=UPI001C01EAA1|nr:fimbrillin family protein [Bacteroides thetaiotaomicron]MBT9899985.1 fimbrillin family protein [Bacteroides thetaiotaomicron]